MIANSIRSMVDWVCSRSEAAKRQNIILPGMIAQ
jgi:hypothetical protein